MKPVVFLVMGYAIISLLNTERLIFLSQSPMIERYGTLGPSCQDVKTLIALFQEGMTGIRLNLSHCDLEECGEWLNHLHTAAQECGVSPDLLIDLKGPELRVGVLSGPLSLEEGKEITLGGDGIPVPSIIFPSLCLGQEILLDDGALLLRVEDCGKTHARCRIIRGGILHSRKSIAIPGAGIFPPTLTESDYKNLSIAKKAGVTGVMLPFVRGKEDLIHLRNALKEVGATDIRIFAKLENRQGIQVLPELLEYADHIVIARGDLGNDIPLWELPGIQYEVSKLCKSVGKPFMVVTQMLHSMTHAAVPTRAEVSDIFHAVLDGASSVMLTGETASGEFPVEAMRYLCRTVDCAQKYIK